MMAYCDTPNAPLQTQKRHYQEDREASRKAIAEQHFGPESVSTKGTDR
jgi:hypothetical protein